MTKKHFKAMAAMFKGLYDANVGNTNKDVEVAIDNMVDSFINLSKDLNPRFDETRFRKACK